jgi:DNA-3-methyladenine glycosylase
VNCTFGHVGYTCHLKIQHQETKVNLDDARLRRDFYAREPTEVAHDLVGTHLVRRTPEGTRIGRIVEAEAYRGAGDPASHAYRGRTARNFPMFGPPGHVYVYFIYGMHWMFNISAHPTAAPHPAPGAAPGAAPRAVPGAVLIRALEPLEGLELMVRSRQGQDRRDLANGPAKLAQALSIDASLNNLDLCTSDSLYVTAGDLRPGEVIASGPRVRVTGDESARTRPWRFWLAGNPYVST